MSAIEPSRGGPLKHRLGPSVVVFVATAVGIYATVYLALGILRHIVIPVLALGIAGYLAAKVYKATSAKP